MKKRIQKPAAAEETCVKKKPHNSKEKRLNSPSKVLGNAISLLIEISQRHERMIAVNLWEKIRTVKRRDQVFLSLYGMEHWHSDRYQNEEI